VDLIERKLDVKQADRDLLMYAQKNEKLEEGIKHVKSQRLHDLLHGGSVDQHDLTLLSLQKQIDEHADIIEMITKSKQLIFERENIFNGLGFHF
jgi:hypothetical protein